MLYIRGGFFSPLRRKERDMKRLSGTLLAILLAALLGMGAVSYTHLTLPTILRV